MKELLGKVGCRKIYIYNEEEGLIFGLFWRIVENLTATAFVKCKVE